MSKPDPYAVARGLGLSPMTPMDLSEASDTSRVLKQMSATAFTGRTLGEAADVMEAMLRDENCRVVMTLSGAMTMAGLGGLILDAMERGWVHCIVSTGALVGHGMVENLGLPHFKADPEVSDEEYFTVRLNRVYDTIEPEHNLDELEARVRLLFDRMADEQPQARVGTAQLLDFLGRHLPGDGILQTAHRLGVPLIIPAFTDSELALDLAVHRAVCNRDGRSTISYDAFEDLEFFKNFCEGITRRGQKLGIFTIGGGVPRNWAQQVGPYVDALYHRLETTVPRLRYDYGVRVCPDPVHYGHLSGCTYSEGVSWGKFLPQGEGGRYAEVLLDATVGWPLLARAMLDRGL